VPRAFARQKRDGPRIRVDGGPERHPGRRPQVPWRLVGHRVRTRLRRNWPASAPAQPAGSLELGGPRPEAPSTNCQWSLGASEARQHDVETTPCRTPTGTTLARPMAARPRSPSVRPVVSGRHTPMT
jgi:hypothetical protein